jgi:hypothetical protein
MITNNYDDFVENLREAGFSLGGGNDEGIFAIIPFSWNKAPDFETPVKWHTGDFDTDPWEWRLRVLDERDDIAYSKVFFRKSGYITKEWYPYFLAVRRNGMSFEEAYQSGTISNDAKRIYNVILEQQYVPMHEMKDLAGFEKDEKSKFERALLELQMKLYVTMCGSTQKISQKGTEYGWTSTVFCTAETFFGEDLIHSAETITSQEAIEKITAQIYRLNPNVDEKKILKFIEG